MHEQELHKLNGLVVAMTNANRRHRAGADRQEGKEYADLEAKPTSVRTGAHTG
jgi:hypothetical protein